MRRFVAMTIAVGGGLVLSPLMDLALGHATRPERLILLSVPATGQPDDCGGPRDFPNNASVEAHLAVDPRNSRRLVAAWQQGIQRYPHVVTAFSVDGGRRFRRVLVPGISSCVAGGQVFTTDEWLSYGPDGTVYLASLSGRFPQGTPPSEKAVVVSVSRDGGQRWSSPHTVQQANGLNDKDAIAADPIKAGLVYIIWNAGNALQFSVSHDHGRRWSPERAIYTAPAGFEPQGGSLVVLANGTMFYSFTNFAVASFFQENTSQRDQVLVIRSTDHGRHWRRAQRIATTSPKFPSDPRTGSVISSNPYTSLAVVPRSGAYVVWHDQAAAGRSKILMSRSADGGRSWQPPVPVAHDRTTPFQPVIAANHDGVIAVAWFDLRGQRTTSTTLPATYWFADSRDHGATWNTTKVAGSFDLSTAFISHANVRLGYFLGDYEGLAPDNGGFATTFTAAHPIAKHAHSDALFAQLAVH